MTTNFQYLKLDWPDLFRLAHDMERSVSPRSVLFKCRLLVEVGLEWLFDHEHRLPHPHGRATLESMIKERALTKVMPGWQVRELDLVRREGNLAAHEPGTISWDRAHRSLKHTHRFLAWLDANYGEEPDEDRKLREGLLPPQKQSQANPSDREAQLEEKLAIADAEVQRLTRENARLEGRLKDQTAQLAAMKMKQDLAAQRRQRNTERGINDEQRLPHPYTDAETRRHLVEVRLREAGWNPEDPSCTNEAPDYVLRTAQGVPVALMEIFTEADQQAQARQLAHEHAEELAKRYGTALQRYISDGEQVWRCEELHAEPKLVEQIPQQGKA